MLVSTRARAAVTSARAIGSGTVKTVCSRARVPGRGQGITALVHRRARAPGAAPLLLRG